MKKILLSIIMICSFVSNVAAKSFSGIEKPWIFTNQGYKIYLVDETNQKVGETLTVVYNSSDVSTNENTITFKELEFLMNEKENSIPLAFGYKILPNGKIIETKYTQDNNLLMVSWLLGNNKKPYYLVDKNNGDYNSLKVAIDSVPNYSTIYIKPGTYVDTIKTSNTLALIGIGSEKNPVLTNTGDKNTGLYNPEMGYYENCPLMIGSGYIKNLDIIEQVTFNDYKALNTPAIPSAYAVHVEDISSMDKYLTFENCNIVSNANAALGMGTRKGMIFQMKNVSLTATPESSGNILFIHDSVDVANSSLFIKTAKDWSTDNMGEFYVGLENCSFNTQVPTSRPAITFKNYKEVSFLRQVKQTGNLGIINFKNCKTNISSEKGNKLCFNSQKYNVEEGVANDISMDIKCISNTIDINNLAFGEGFKNPNAFDLDYISSESVNPQMEISLSNNKERIYKLLNIQLNNKKFFHYKTKYKLVIEPIKY